MKKVWIASILVMMFLLLFSACGNTGAGSSSLSTVSVAPSEQASNTMPESVPDESSSLSFAQEPASGAPEPSSTNRSEVGDFVGTVATLTSDGFTCSGSNPVTTDGYATGGTGQNINVVYAADVEFTKCLYNASDDTSEIQPSSKDDVVAGKTVTLWGSQSGETFTATAVQVFEPVG